MRPHTWPLMGTLLAAVLLLHLCLATRTKTKRSRPRRVWITNMYDYYRNHSAREQKGLISLNSDMEMETCDSLMGLARRQKRLCKKHIRLMKHIASGAYQALEQCKAQFSNHRWNCHLAAPHTYFHNSLRKGTRETAFVYSIGASGVAHSITRGCSRGEFDNCGCDKSIYDHPNEEGYVWSGCSDNIHFGIAFSKLFVDANEKIRKSFKKPRKKARKMMNLHNNEVGRKTLEKMMRVQCKCHGISGSCEIRTCWRSLPHFKLVGKELKSKFDIAMHVQYTSRELRPRQSSYRSNPSPDRLQLEHLVYLEVSPTYCNSNLKSGSVGTRNRVCNKTVQNQMNSCNVMCCERGYRTEIERYEERCNCKFLWCCKVKCDVCRKKRTVTRCN